MGDGRRRDRRAQRRAAVEALARAGWTEQEVQDLFGVLLEVAETDGVDFEVLTARLVAEERQQQWGWAWDEADEADEEAPRCPVCAAEHGASW